MNDGIFEKETKRFPPDLIVSVGGSVAKHVSKSLHLPRYPTQSSGPCIVSGILKPGLYISATSPLTDREP